MGIETDVTIEAHAAQQTGNNIDNRDPCGRQAKSDQNYLDSC
jgi:hypothetical protein